MMRSVVVLPQPDGPSRVVKLARGTSSETSSTAAAPPLPNRLTRWTRRTWASGIGDFAKANAAATHRPYDEENADGHADDGNGEGGCPAPVEVVHQLEDRDRRDSRAWREQKND